MDFFNSLSQIAKNKDRFKQWETNQKDGQARREELYKRRQYTDAEIAKAKALGENIIDVVDIMDNHSESVAENVETATEPIVGIAPTLGFLAALGINYKLNLKKNYKQIYNIEQKYAENAANKELVEKIRDFNHNNNINNGFSYYDLTSKREIKRIKNSQLKSEATKVFKQFEKDIAKYKRANTFGWIAVGAATLASFIGANIYAAKLQVDSSKIARYQARESLKNPKAFVTYTPEQIAKAKEEIQKHPELLKEKKKEKLQTGMFKSIINLFKDRKAYKQSIKNDKDESKIVTRELTPEELKCAKQDQEVIQRTVRIINNEAEKYSQNMEVAAEVIINGTPFLGAAIGGAVGWVLNKFGVIEKYIDKKVSQNGSEETKNLYADLKKGKESGKTIHFKWGKFFDSYMRDLRKNTSINTETGVKEVKHKQRDIVKKSKRVISALLAHPWGKKGIIGAVGAFVTSIAGLMIGLKLQKSAARAGRYTAKRELEKDPRNFIGYTEDDYNEVKDVKSNKKGISKVKEIIMFIPTVMKQYWAYEKYKKLEYKEKQVLNEQLQKQEITDEQLREAKNLQRKLFNTFEKVDDNSQTYSESTEAAIDIAQPFVMYGGLAALASPFIIAGIQIKRGKLSAAKVLNKITGFFSKSSERMKSKWFKKYLNNVADNVSKTVQNTNVHQKPIGTLIKGVDFKNDGTAIIISKIFQNIKNSTTEFRKLDNEAQRKLLSQLSYEIGDKLSVINPKLAKKLDDIISSFNWRVDSPQARADILDIITNPQSIKAMSKERYQKAYDFINSTIKKLNANNTTYEEYRKSIDILYTNIQNHVKKINTDKLKEMVSKIDEIPILAGKVDKAEFEKIIKNIEDIKTQVERYNIENAVNALFSQKNMVTVIESINKAKAKFNEIPEMVNKYPQLKALMKEFELIGSDILQNHQKELAQLEKLGIKVPKDGKVTFESGKEMYESIKNLKIQDIKKLLTDRSPKAVLNRFKNKITNMSDDDFAMYVERIRFSSMDKKTLLEIIPKLEKIFDNIPKAESQKIWNKIVEEMQTHPDEFLQLLRSGKIGKIFMTPGLEKAIAAAGISWAVFTLALTYAIESWLADIQLKAGRLGVMKAIEGLEDPRYYADIEPAKQTTQVPQAPANQSNSSSLLKKFSQ